MTPIKIINSQNLIGLLYRKLDVNADVFVHTANIVLSPLLISFSSPSLFSYLLIDRFYKQLEREHMVVVFTNLIPVHLGTTYCGVCCRCCVLVLCLFSVFELYFVIGMIVSHITLNFLVGFG